MRFTSLLFLILLTSCIPRTQTDVPAFSGIVVDSNSGNPLADVRIKEIAVSIPDGSAPQTTIKGSKNREAQTVITLTTGHFSYPAITSGITFQLPVPGAGWPVHRALIFQKNGYRDTTCSCTNLSLFGKENHAVIPLIQIAHSEAEPASSMILVNDSIKCEAFVGSRVIYENKSYMIGEIYRQDEQKDDQQLFSLWPVPPNKGDVVMDVPDYLIQLVVPEQTPTEK